MLTLCLIGLTSAAPGKKVHGEIVCFGDSITHGAMVDGKSWVWYLQQEKLDDVTFINEGRSGRKTADTVELPPVVEKYPHAAYYLIFLGVNDLKDGNETMVEHCVTNMKWMISRIRMTDPAARIVLLAPTDINTKIMSPINVKKKYNENTRSSLAGLAKKYRVLAKREHTGFISLLHTVSPPNYADGLHPNGKGQQQIAAAVWKGLNKLY
jgi:lysophospholipase L1-like esterase